MKKKLIGWKKAGFFVLAIVTSASVMSCSKAGEKPPAPGPPVIVTPPKDTVPSLATVRSWLVDEQATEQTAALFYNLKKISKTIRPITEEMYHG